MNLFWKGAAALLVAGSAMTVASAPAQAQYYRGGWNDGGWRDNGWRNDRGWRGDRGWRDDRRWDNRGWRGDRYRGGWRNDYRRCWNEWRRGYHGQRVRVRICR